MIYKILIIILLIFIPNTYAENFLLTEKFNRNFVDVNKNQIDESNLCWAITSINMYLFSINEKESEANYYLDYIKKQKGNVSGWVESGFSLITRANAKILGPRKTPYSLEGEIFSDDSTWNKNIDLWIKGLILARCIVGITLDYPYGMGSHAITCYGFYESKEIGMWLYYVDSDDKIRKLHCDKIGKSVINDRIIFETGKYRGYKISKALALKITPDELPKYGKDKR